MNKKLRLMLVFLLTLGIIAGYTTAVGANESVTVPIAQENENGCVGCHKGTSHLPDGTEIDVTLTGETKRIPDHPEIKADATFATCLECHASETGKLNQFRDRLHGKHLNSPVFKEQLQGACNSCHNMKSINGFGPVYAGENSSVIAQMKVLSAAWHTAPTKVERDALHVANRELGKVAGFTYNSATGKWLKKDGTPAY